MTMTTKGPPPRFREPGGLGCLLVGAGIPTAALTSIARAMEGKTAPFFVPALYIGISTAGVLRMLTWAMVPIDRGALAGDVFCLGCNYAPSYGVMGGRAREPTRSMDRDFLAKP